MSFYVALGLICALLIGFVLGATLMLSYVMGVMAKALKASLSGGGGATSPAMTSETKQKIIEWIKEAAAIAERQVALARQLDYPSKNASHSRWKNGIVAQMKEMEAKKIELFRQIVSAGFDPDITSIGADGKPTKIKMSAAITNHATAEPPAPVTKPLKNEDVIAVPPEVDGGAKIYKFPSKNNGEER